MSFSNPRILLGKGKMSSLSITFEHKNGISLIREEVAQLENRNPQYLNSLPLMPAISLNLSISSPQNTKKEKKKKKKALSLYISIPPSLSIFLSIAPSCNPFIVILLSIKKKVVSEFFVHNFHTFFIFF